eukprot:jgi/Chrzof1/5105/Cz15g11180.t1
MFGMSPHDLVSRPFTTLVADTEAFDGFLAAAATASAECISTMSLHIRMKHKYLPAVEVDLTVELAGTEDQRILVFNIRCLSATSNLLMVLDQRGKLTYATSQLADAVGYPVKTLSRMDVKAIVPSPYTQLHDIWMKVMLSSESERLSQKRLMLTLNEQGQVIAATNATPTSLFGFSPHDVIGAPLSAFVNVFEEWQRQGKDVISLLALLVTHEQEHAGSCWRVGLHAPKQQSIQNPSNVQTDASTTQTTGIFGALRQKQHLHAAVMRLELIHQDPST